jgi:hemolysin III
MISDIKPVLRGHFHQAAFFVAVGASAMLMWQAHSLHTFIPALIYSAGLLTMFGVSALYHRPKWNDDWRVLMKRLDHSAIFVMIAGSGTPLSMLALPGNSGARLLTTMWLAAAAGVLKCLVWVHSPKWVSAVLYIGAGWITVMFVSEIRDAISPTQFACLVGGGVVYSVGAIIYACKWPNPSPKYFGYHEVFHILVIVGAAMHFFSIQPLIV